MSNCFVFDSAFAAKVVASAKKRVSGPFSSRMLALSKHLWSKLKNSQYFSQVLSAKQNLWASKVSYSVFSICWSRSWVTEKHQKKGETFLVLNFWGDPGWHSAWLFHKSHQRSACHKPTEILQPWLFGAVTSCFIESYRWVGWLVYSAKALFQQQLQLLRKSWRPGGSLNADLFVKGSQPIGHSIEKVCHASWAAPISAKLP